MITTTLDRTDDAVSVTTVETPPTSLESRDWISPVRVDVKNRKRHVLKMRVQRVPQVLHHAEPDEVRLIGLRDPERAGDDRDDHHQRHPEIDDVDLRDTRPRRHVPGGSPNNPWLKIQAISSGLTTPSPDVIDDQKADQRNLAPVGPESRHDPTDRVAVDRTIVPLARDGEETAVSAHATKIRRRRANAASGRSHSAKQGNLSSTELTLSTLSANQLSEPAPPTIVSCPAPS